MRGIYAIVNHVSGKAYIGSTADSFSHRWANHRCGLRRGDHRNPHLQAAWNKYGIDAFELLVCEYVKNVREDPGHLIEREQYWLDEFRLVGEVYNAGTMVVNPMLGRPVSGETRRKLSEAGKGRVVSEETRKKLSEAMKGKQYALGSKHSEEANLRKSKALRGEGNGMYGKSHSEKTRQQMSAARMGKHHSKKTKDKISKSRIGKSRAPFSKEWRRNLSKAHAGCYPSFCNKTTGEVIPAGRNLTALCREHGLDASTMCNVKNGKVSSYKGWIVAG